MKKKLRVALLFGGKTAEHEISIKSAKAIYDNLDKEKYDVLPLPFTRDNNCMVPLPKDGIPLLELNEDTVELGKKVLEQQLISQQFDFQEVSPALLNKEFVDIVIPIIHGSFGEDGRIQGMLDVLGIPYIGAGVLGSSIGMDKEIQKILVKDKGIRVAPYTVIHFSEWSNNQEICTSLIETSLSLPFFVKPANAGSSVGISKVETIEELSTAMDFACKYDQKVIIEEGLTNVKEVESAVIGCKEVRVASAFSEIRPDRAFYDYDAKYHPDSQSKVIIPADFTEEEKMSLKKAAETVFKALQCQGLARVDFFLTNDGDVIFNEINTLPGFTPISAFSKMWAASGVPYPELLDLLISYGIEAFEERNQTVYELLEQRA